MELPKEATLETLVGGAVPELFDRELQRVLANINDPNTKAKAKRTISLKVTIAPYKDRSGADLAVECTSKIAPVDAAEGRIYIADRNGKLSAHTADLDQGQLYSEDSSKKMTAV